MARRIVNSKNNTLFDKIQFSLRNTKLSNTLIKYTRTLRSGKKKELPIGKLAIPKVELPKKTRTYLIIGVVILLFIGLLYSLSVVFSINPKGYEVEETSMFRKKTFDGSINVLFIGFESRLNSYKYIKYLNVVSVDSKNSIFKVYGISPNFLTSINGENVTLESIWNNIVIEDETPKINAVVDEIQRFSGIRLDKYIAFNIDDLKSYINTSRMTDTAQDTSSFDGRLFTKGEVLAGDFLYDYLFDKTQARDVLTLRQMNFQKSMLEGIRGPIKMARNYIGFTDFNSVFKMDFSRDEYMGFLSTLNTSEIIFSPSYFISDKFGIGSEDPLDFSVSPDYNLIDENVSGYFRDIEIMKEQSAVEVYNATNTPGLAGNRRRFFQNLGANVVKFGNYPISGVQTSLLYVPSKNVDLYKNNIIMIQKLLRGNVKITFEEYKYNFSGDLILVMGEDTEGI